MPSKLGQSGEEFLVALSVNLMLKGIEFNVKRRQRLASTNGETPVVLSFSGLI